jgi:hypothetical protein
MLRWAGGGQNQIAEGANAEAYIPLPDGRTVPVTMKMTAPGQYAFSEMPKPQINLSVPVEVHNNTDAKVEVSRSPAGANGIQGIKILIDQAVESSISRGRFDPAMRARYGHRPALTRR